MGLEEKLASRIEKYFDDKNTRYAPAGNRASSIGYPCLRYHVYSRTRWNEAAPLPQGTLEIFGEGNDQEATVNRWLLDMGFRLNNINESFPPNEWQLTGHIDGQLSDPETGETIPVDIKTNHPNIYPTINTVEDLNKKHWMKKWFYQCQAYMLLLDESIFWIIMKDKTAKRIKIIKIKRDETIIQEIKDRCAAINKHLEAGTVPEKLNDLETCEICQYNHICLPEYRREAAQIADDPEFLISLDRRAELKAARDEYEKLDKAVKATVKNTNGSKFICGSYYIEKKQYERKGFVVKASTSTRITISSAE